MTSSVATAGFKTRARLLALLGDQLIGSDTLAVFELVKNAYDADASHVTITLTGLENGEPRLTVEDNGDGMDLAIIKNVWLEIGNDYREKQRRNLRRTPRFKRLPLGEKGVGRIAVHKLGAEIDLTTRARASEEELIVHINWDELLEQKYLDQTKVIIRRRSPSYFVGKKVHHGTKIAISRLRRTHWSRGDIRRLQRSVTSISSPFESRTDFTADLVVPEHPEWIEDIPNAKELIAHAPWSFEFSLEVDATFEWHYSFRSPLRNVEGRDLHKRDDKLLLPPDRGTRRRVVADPRLLEGIGPIKGKLVAYDRDRKILAMLPQTTLFRDFFDEQSGIRVFRDGMRVHNYGEPNEDWLGLDSRRVNRPTERLSRNIVVGAINISLALSNRLREKTNREGFDENEAFERFKLLVTSIISTFEVERALDKSRLRRVLEDEVVSVPVETPLAEIREVLAKSKSELGSRLNPYLDRLERDYIEMRDLMLKAGMTGLNLSIIIHEVERGIRSLYEDIKADLAKSQLEIQARSLMHLVEGVTGLLRKKSERTVDVPSLVAQAIELCERRILRHHVALSRDIDESLTPPFKVRGSHELLLGTLVNLIDNSLYWLRVRWPEAELGKRRLYVGITKDLPGGRGIVVADNGPGFQDVPETLLRPFFTRKPDGMGLGLYYASLVMSLCGGKLVMPPKGEVDLPRGMDGAVIVLQFPEER